MLGEKHADTARTINNLGYLLQEQGDLIGAQAHFEQALTIQRAVLGDQHPETALCLNNLGALLEAQGDLARAREHYGQAVAICEARLGVNHPTTVTMRANLTELDTTQGPIYKQIEEIIGQAKADIEQVRVNGTLAEQAAIAEKVKERAKWAEQGEAEGSPYKDLAIRLRTLAATLQI